ncbi:hypothetical protein RSOLAG1IB_10207 [Rhizoctonia solani AG-1 IB]|uniref:Uncharacterized protein n=1 Tax=Thanatephorus cucumeris (strain AG1-IB / isolate 7/3/14) TaxID=1108050 RepID=A0A0B7FWP3_THACB|nr:hypothetical protein RSOLAG1IB_10207 [Rhizoctonia solani AG-1 IB]
METLPPYESPEQATRVHFNTVPSPSTNDSTTEVLEGGVIGGSGVRLPLSSRERISFDRKTCSRLRQFGPYVRNGSLAYGGVQPKTETFCPPEHIYQTAASQLDVLLPALSTGTLPSTTALRTITIRLDLPAPDVAWMNETLRTRPPPGRDTFCRAYKSWLTHFATKKMELALLETAESITGRVAMEGFLVLEEWWDPRRGLLKLTVRC